MVCLLHSAQAHSRGTEQGTSHSCLQAPATLSHPEPSAHLELHAIARVDRDGVGAVQAAIIGDTSWLWGHQPALGTRQRLVAGSW